MTESMTGAQSLVRALERAGVDTVFGIPGGACLPIYDALYDSPIRHVLMRHEAAAGHAAEGYARASGRVGVAIGTSGPGATNLVTAIADAYMDSMPMVAITGQVTTLSRHQRLPGGRRDRDHAADRQAHLPRQSPRRCRRRSPTRYASPPPAVPGPVLIDLPTDVLQAKTHPPRDATRDPYLPGYRPRERPNGRARSAGRPEALAAARRPVLYVGGGVVQAETAPNWANSPR